MYRHELLGIPRPEETRPVIPRDSAPAPERARVNPATGKVLIQRAPAFTGAYNDAGADPSALRSSHNNGVI